MKNLNYNSFTITSRLVFQGEKVPKTTETTPDTQAIPENPYDDPADTVSKGAEAQETAKKNWLDFQDPRKLKERYPFAITGRGILKRLEELDIHGDHDHIDSKITKLFGIDTNKKMEENMVVIADRLKDGNFTETELIQADEYLTVADGQIPDAVNSEFYKNSENAYMYRALLDYARKSNNRLYLGPLNDKGRKGGFFNNKPDRFDKEWPAFWEKVQKKDE